MNTNASKHAEQLKANHNLAKLWKDGNQKLHNKWLVMYTEGNLSMSRYRFSELTWSKYLFENHANLSQKTTTSIDIIVALN